MMNPENSKTLTIDVDADTSVHEVLAAAAAMVVRINQGRGELRLRRLRPVRVVLDLGADELTADEERALEDAAATAFTRYPPFQSPEEVRQFFTMDTIAALYGGEPKAMTPERLAAAAEAVIKTRVHCHF